MKSVLAIVGLAPVSSLLSNRGVDALENLIANAAVWERAAELYDDDSRRLLKEILAFRIVGPHRIRLPTNTPRYWSTLEAVKKSCIGVLDSEARTFNIETTSPPLKMIGTVSGIHCTFYLEQYRYRGKSREIAVATGDTVIDCGACWGDTAIYFSRAVGSSGRVYAFEFAQANLINLRKNLAEHSGGAPIEIVEKAVWNRSDESLSYFDRGHGTILKSGTGDRTAKTIRIDDWIAENKIGKVDFIKMDIEGAELMGLEGAKGTIERDRPKLAIAGYHLPLDLATIPEWIRSLDLGYRIYLDHFTIHEEESIIFAACDKQT